MIFFFSLQEELPPRLQHPPTSRPITTNSNNTQGSSLGRKSAAATQRGSSQNQQQSAQQKVTINQGLLVPQGRSQYQQQQQKPQRVQQQQQQQQQQQPQRVVISQNQLQRMTPQYQSRSQGKEGANQAWKSELSKTYASTTRLPSRDHLNYAVQARQAAPGTASQQMMQLSSRATAPAMTFGSRNPQIQQTYGTPYGTMNQRAEKRVMASHQTAQSVAHNINQSRSIAGIQVPGRDCSIGASVSVRSTQPLNFNSLFGNGKTLLSPKGWPCRFLAKPTFSR